VSWPHIYVEDREHARQRRTDVEDQVTAPSMAVSVQRRAADPIVVVIRGDRTLADTSARRLRLQSDAARPRSGAVENGRRGCVARSSIPDTSGDGTRGACGCE
jgi:hypothetical protein